MINISMPDTEVTMKPRIVVFGVGGAGGNAVANMIRSGLTDIDFVVANTDAQVLATNPAAKKLQLGRTVTKGLGAGARPDLGRAAAEEQLDEINAHLDGANMCFITAGMGGGTGTGAGPVIARVARERGILTVGVVTKPFQFEGPVRMRSAEAGIQDLQQYVDTLIIIPNQNLFRIANERTTWTEAFKLADDVLYQGVRGVTDLIMTPGQINLDFADIRSVMSEMGKAMMGTGEAEGDNRALQAAEMAINNPLLDDASVKGARGVLINITGGPDLTLFEVEEAANRIRDEVDPDANIIFGTAMDETMQGRIRISVVATGIDLEVSRNRPPLTVVGGTQQQGGYVQPQSAYTQPQANRPAPAQQSAMSAPLFSQQPMQPSAATARQQAPATMGQVNNQAGANPSFYSGLQPEQVGNVALAQQPLASQPQMSQPTMARPAQQPVAPVRGLRQGEQFIAPQPAQVMREPQPAYQAPLAATASAQAMPSTSKKPGLFSKVKNFMLATDMETATAQPQTQIIQQGQTQAVYAPQPQAQTQVAAQPAQAARSYEVTQGGKAGLPPVEDNGDLDIPSFLRRQAN